MSACWRALLMSALDAAGFRYTAPEGTYFIMADYTPLFSGSALEFTRYLIQEAGVACIPPVSGG